MKSVFLAAVLFSFLSCFPAQGQSPKDTCDYVLEIPDSMLNKTARLYMFSLGGIEKKEAKKLREKLILRTGEEMVLDRSYFDRISERVCQIGKYKLSKINAIPCCEHLPGHVNVSFLFERPRRVDD